MQPVPRLPGDSVQRLRRPRGPAASAVSLDGGSACSTLCHDGCRTLSAPSHSHGTNPPAALSPLDYDDHLPLQTLRSYQESTTAKPHLTGAFPLTLTLHLPRVSLGEGYAVSLPTIDVSVV